MLILKVYNLLLKTYINKYKITQMEYLINKITYVKTLLNYETSSNQQNDSNVSIQEVQKMTQLQKIVHLRKTLQSIKTYPQHIQGKIEMFFSSLFKNQSIKYIAFTTHLPCNHPVSQKSSQKKIISLRFRYTLQSGQIVCPLNIWIVFLQQYPENLPKFYVQCPSFSSNQVSNQQNNIINSKPSLKYVQIVKNSKINPNNTQYNFKATTGGIEVILNQIQEKQKGDIKKLFQKCIQLMKREFPFVKMKNQRIVVNKQLNRDQDTQFLYRKSKLLRDQLQRQFIKLSQSMRQIDIDKYDSNNSLNNKPKQQKQYIQNQLPQIINNIQQLDILKKSIQSQTKNLKLENKQLKIFISQTQNTLQQIQKQNKYSQFYPAIHKNQGLQQQLFDNIVNHQATKDCVLQLEHLVFQKKSGVQNQQKYIQKSQFNKAFKMYENLSQKMFYQRYKIKSLVQKLKQKHKNQQ